MAKSRKTTPAETESLAAAGEPQMDQIIDEALAGEPGASSETEVAEPTVPLIVLEAWDAPEIQALQINWQEKAETRELGVPLTREEIQDHATKLADTVTEIRELEDAKKASADHYKALITDQEKIQNRVSALIRQGHDVKPVPCAWIFEVAGRDDAGKFIRDPNYKTIIRKDTGAVIEVKPITADERQMGLPLDDATEAETLMEQEEPGEDGQEEESAQEEAAA